MSPAPAQRASLVVLLSGLLLTVACDAAPKDVRLRGFTPPSEPPPTGTESALCLPAKSGEQVPARNAVMNGAKGSAGGIYTADLYGQFVDHCGSCHTQGRNNGGFDVNAETFASKISALAIERMRSENPALVMPPPVSGQPALLAERPDGDPLKRFAGLIDRWLELNKPDVFQPEMQDGDGNSAGGAFGIDSQVGMQLTNLGNCIPASRVVKATEHMDTMRSLDDKFAAMQSFADLPRNLKDTDLTTYDAAQLAKSAVIAYAPQYTLWADNAKKIRHLRLPAGSSIHFDAAKQQFEIPDNTRFYKTFLKRVIDQNGVGRYRKMETRIIVARRDAETAPGDAYKAKALFGTYQWNEAESEATLVDVAYRDGTDFADHVESYVADERLEDQVLRSGKQDLASMLAAGARKNYAIPGADRCIHCHMGAPARSFILGFTPLQIKRRPMGEGGVLEPAGEHELDQLARLIDYGLITGVDSPDQLLPLEESQGTRKPRNAYELDAQGYMLGNCAHCHNPNGFPSKREAVLADALDFMPSATGGVFQFPLEKTSPRTFRGLDQDVTTPYITPSLFDHPTALAANRNGVEITPQGMKLIARVTPEPGDAQLGLLLGQRYPALSPLPSVVGRPLVAPWRSLIYRNVDAPFSYEDGATTFPHMPMDTPGYDCRSRQILGSWMVSIPAKRKPPPGRGLSRSVPVALADYEEQADTLDQPYVEIDETDTNYSFYAQQTRDRLARFQNSERYRDCPSPELDIVAPEVASGRSVLPAGQLTELLDAAGQPREQYWLQSAARPHYPKTDLRDDPSWVVRRDDWNTVLLVEGVDRAKQEAGGSVAQQSADVIGVVRELTLSQSMRTFALGERPFGLWEPKAECTAKLASQSKVSSLVGSARPSWIDLSRAAPDAALYSIAPGAQVFGLVCSKCHGPDATGQSALAASIADLTGGVTRVANLRDGLFGTPQDRGANRMREFASAGGMVGGSAEDWAARYMVWMGLGGTNAAIPKTALTQIGAAKVLGQSRKQNFAAVTDPKAAANMLNVAKRACETLLADSQVPFDLLSGKRRRNANEVRHAAPLLPDSNTLEDMGFIVSNGDAELWEQLCTFENPLPVRVVGCGLSGPAVSGQIVPPAEPTEYAAIYARDAYPSDAAVGDQNGRTTSGIQADNLAPWCIGTFSGDLAQACEAEVSAAEAKLGRALPRCPGTFLGNAKRWPAADGRRWAVRGAVNAGLAVYVYLDALARGEVQPQPAFDRCQDLPVP